MRTPPGRRRGSVGGPGHRRDTETTTETITGTGEADGQVLLLDEAGGMMVTDTVEVHHEEAEGVAGNTETTTEARQPGDHHEVLRLLHGEVEEQAWDVDSSPSRKLRLIECERFIIF